MSTLPKILYEGNKPIQDASRTHWSVLHKEKVTFRATARPNSGVNPASYTFRVHFNSADTGFYEAFGPNIRCADTSFSFKGASSSTTMIRCGQGVPSNKGMMVTAKLTNSSDTPVAIYRTGYIEKGWHRADLETSYVMSLDSPAGGKSPSIRETYGSSEQSGFERAFTNGAAAWNKDTKRTVFRPVTGSADVEIGVYWWEKAGYCGAPLQGYKYVLGCTSPGTGTYPHIGEQKLWMKFPPAESGSMWTDNANDAQALPHLYYLPQVVMHELGHSAGLGHLYGLPLIMGEQTRNPVTAITTRDHDAMIEVTNPHAH